MKNRILLLSILISSFAWCQPYHQDYWIFGQRQVAGGSTPITMNFAPAVGALPSPDISTSTHPATPPNNILPSDDVLMNNEGCVVVTNPSTGNLLFYTDGVNLWNRNHQMITGATTGVTLQADPSSAQPVAVCPIPVCPVSEYYVFSNTSSQNVGTSNITWVTYNAVTESFGAGGTLTTLGGSGVTEGLLLIPGDDPNTWWLVAHEVDVNTYVAWPIDETGIGAPVYSNAGPNYGNGVGQFAISNNTPAVVGSPTIDYEMAVINRDINSVFTVLFDATTGSFSNGTTIFNTPLNGKYDVEFSPNGTYVYFTAPSADATAGGIFQFNLITNTLATITLPVTQIGIYGIKLGPDGLLYYLRKQIPITPTGTMFIGRLNNPNNPAATTNPVEGFFGSGGGINGVVAHNFPEFLEWDETLVENYWHQTTSSAADGDVYHDIVTDLDGNVYVTGSFIESTTLIDGVTGLPVDLNTASPGKKAAFVAKYNSCGGLEWVSQEEGFSDYSEGTSLVLDEQNGHVYVAGNFLQQMKLFSSNLCPGTVLNLASTGRSGFVARYKMSNGCLDLLGSVTPAEGTELTSICVNELSGVTSPTEIFVSGMVTSAPGFGPVAGTESFVRRLDFPMGGSTFPLMNWEIRITGTGSAYQKVSEIDFDENLNKLWMIGTFYRDILFSYGGPMFAAAPDKKSFIAGYDNSPTSPSFYWGSKSTGGSSLNSSGEGIAVDELTGNVYLTGTYMNNHSSAFGFTGANWSNNNTFNAYHMSIKSYATSAPTLNWSRETDAGSGFDENAYGADVSFINHKAHFVGHYTNDLIIEDPVSGGISLPYTLAPYTNGDHIFTVTYDEVNGDASAVNATEAIDVESRHIPTAICTHLNGHNFISGFYEGEMQYQIGDPYSGPLVSSGSPLAHNAFAMRVDYLGGGAYRSQQTTNENEEEIADEINIQENNLDLSIYPNPTNGELKVELNAFDAIASYRVELRSITGQLIFMETLNQQTSNFDLSDLDNGIYLISISNGESNITKRIVKQ